MKIEGYGIPHMKWMCDSIHKRDQSNESGLVYSHVSFLKGRHEAVWVSVDLSFLLAMIYYYSYSILIDMYVGFVACEL